MAMATSATAVCQLILNQLRSSNLNFIVSETPYSAQIMLRKRFVKEASGPAWAKAPKDQYEPNNIIDDQSEMIKNLEQNNQSLSESNRASLIWLKPQLIKLLMKRLMKLLF